MPKNISRRDVIKSAASVLALPSIAFAAALRIVIVGGGFGGVAAALFVRRFLPNAEVILIERNRFYRAPPFSNFVAVGAWQEAAITRSYASIAKTGIRIIHALVTRLVNNDVELADGSVIPYDTAIISPGVGFDFSALPGVNDTTALLAPHAYDGDMAGLRARLAAIPAGGTMAIIPPAGAYRCPPAPYERAGLVAEYLVKRGLRAKVLIFDQKEKFSQQTLFEDGWAWYYRDRVEWFASSAGGLVEQLDAQGGRIFTEFGEEKADVISYIPPQRAAAVALSSGLNDDSGWCPVNATTMESRQMPSVYVIGDAAAVAPLPKSAAAAIGMARLAATHIAQLYGKAVDDTSHIANLCFSYLTTDSAFAEQGEYLARSYGMRRLHMSLSERHAGEEKYRAIANNGFNWHAQTIQMLFMPTL